MSQKATRQTFPLLDAWNECKMDLENASRALKHQFGRGFWGKVLAMKVSEAYTSHCHWAVFNSMPMLCVSMWRPSSENQ